MSVALSLQLDLGSTHNRTAMPMEGSGGGKIIGAG
jgi:hypothetical protein